MRRVTVFSCLTLIALSFLFLASACGGGGEENPFGVRSELVTEADRPLAMAFAPDGRLFYGEQVTGNIRVVTADGDLLPDPFAQVDVAAFFRWGLSGLALDPDFEANHYVYAFFTEPVSPDGPIGRPVLVRFRDENNRGTDRKIILRGLPKTPVEHAGVNASGGIGFGPDGFLYLTIGDYETGIEIGPEGKPFAQDLTTPIGKMLRVNKEDGSPAEDNPFADDPEADPRIFARGFLWPFNFAFHPQTGQIYGTDSTPSCEELNIITAGGNYGWPDVGDWPFQDCFAGEQIKAIHLFAVEGRMPGDLFSFTNISGLEFVSGEIYPLLGDSLLVCESWSLWPMRPEADELMRRVVLSGTNFDQVAEDDAEDDIVLRDCDMDIATSPDGIIYYSNLTEIRRLVPIPLDSPSE